MAGPHVRRPRRRVDGVLLLDKPAGRSSNAALQHTAGFLRSELSHRLKLYSVPQLHFAYDDSIESGMRISQLDRKSVV